MDRSFRREISALDELFDFVDGFLREHGLATDIGFATKLTVEELFTNLVRHNVGGLDHIDVGLELTGDSIIIRMSDWDVEPFDMDERREIDIHRPLNERSIGGLGLHIVRSLMDHLTFEYSDRTMRITAVKTLVKADV